jgi:hypothetical protein
MSDFCGCCEEYNGTSNIVAFFDNSLLPHFICGDCVDQMQAFTEHSRYYNVMNPEDIDALDDMTSDYEDVDEGAASESESSDEETDDGGELSEYLSDEESDVESDPESVDNSSVSTLSK